MRSSEATPSTRLAEAIWRAEQAEALLRVNQSLASSGLDLDTIVKRATDEATTLTGASFGAFFYDVVEPSGLASPLYAVSEASRTAFHHLLAPTFNGAAAVRIDELANQQSPVVSSLAAVVTIPGGDVLGGIFLGHREAAHFSTQHEEVVRSIAASASWAIDAARLVKGLRHAELAQKRLVDELSETVRLNELFTGVLAHDLRNPLSGILAAAQQQLRRSAAAGPDKTLTRIVSSGERMARLIEQLLDVTRVRNGGMPIHPRPADLLAVVRNVVVELEQAHPEWAISLQHAGQMAGTWDVDRLSQVFSNLVGNAIQHGAPEGGVQVQLTGTDDSVTATVHNRGAVPADRLASLFEPLGRGSRGERRTGLGLGLFISSEIVRSHGGSVQVDSSAELGTTFTVTLPRVAAVAAVENEARGTRQVEEASERVWESEQRTALLVNSVREYAIFMLDQDGYVTTWNAGAERIKGYRREEILGKHFSIFYPPEDAAAGLCDRLLRHAREQGSATHEGWRVRKDGTRFWASVTFTALRSRAGEHVGFAKVTRDLTEQRTHEEQRLRMAQVNESIRLRDEFLAIVSHELKTPLTGLLLQLQMLRKRQGEPAEQRGARVDKAVQSGSRLGELIDSLVDAARFSAGTFTLTRQHVDLAGLLANVLDEFKAPAEYDGTALVISVDAPEPITGQWDPVRIEQMVRSLLSNALRFGVGRPVELKLVARGNGALLEVRDHGAGFSAVELNRLFERFQRGGSLQHSGGIGLGLYIAREIVAAHGGTIAAQNADGGGALMRVWLPFAVADEVSA